jgi:hypothetical protein
MKDDELRKIAKNRVEFRDHLTIYILINIGLFLINHFTSPGFYWVIFVVVFWGIGLAFHYREAYHGTDAQRIEREYQKLKKDRKRA